MATPAQIHANQINAQRSTGPRTPEGKAAVAQNRTTHGLTGAFILLPSENRDEFRHLLDGYIAEYSPETPTENFLVNELAQAEWRIRRADAMEAELLNTAENALRDSNGMLDRLSRYAQAARRAYYKAQTKLEDILRDRHSHAIRQGRADTNEYLKRVGAFIHAPLPTSEQPIPFPIPADLQRELDAHFRRDPLFDPKNDASQMSKALRRWFERFGQAPVGQAGNSDADCQSTLQQQ